MGHAGLIQGVVAGCRKVPSQFAVEFFTNLHLATKRTWTVRLQYLPPCLCRGAEVQISADKITEN